MAVNPEAHLAARRAPNIYDGVVGLGGAALSTWAVVGIVRKMASELPWLEVGTTAWRRGYAASLASELALGMIVAAVALWLYGTSVRAALGLTRGRSTFRTSGWWTLRGLVLLVCVTVLGAHAASELVAKGGETRTLVCSALVWLVIAVDGIPMIRDARAALRARRRLSGVPFAPLDALPPSGVVHISGRVAGKDEDEDVLSGSFIVQERGRRIEVVVAPEALVVESTGHGWEAPVRAGDLVHVIGELDAAGAGAAYRSGVRHLSAHQGRLYVLRGPASLARRLLLTACVEIASAALLLGLGVAFACAWIWLSAQA
jgi:hypothetical protein